MLTIVLAVQIVLCSDASIDLRNKGAEKYRAQLNSALQGWQHQSVDISEFERTAPATVAGWRAALREPVDVEHASQILRRIIEGKIDCTPGENERGKFWDLKGEGTLRGAFPHILASPGIPSWNQLRAFLELQNLTLSQMEELAGASQELVDRLVAMAKANAVAPDDVASRRASLEDGESSDAPNPNCTCTDVESLRRRRRPS